MNDAERPTDHKMTSAEGIDTKSQAVTPIKSDFTAEFQDYPPAIQKVIKKYQARIRQLKQEISSRHEENEKIVAENLRQHDELRKLNQDLDKKVKERTRELQESKEKLEQQNKELQELNESKEAMMHMIVHDMKNPLTSVMGALNLSQNPRYEMNPDLKELLRDANIQSIKLRTMIDDILAISKMRSKEFEIQPVPVDLISLVRQSVMLMNTTMGEKKVCLRFDPKISELIVNIDFQMIERVINNVINNAIKYAPDNSEILLEVTQEDTMACIHVSNWGEVIPADCHEKIFTMFGRVKPQDKKVSGTGLGLAFCKLAVEAHKGTICVESPVPSYDVGAHFYFTLPLYQEKSE